MGDRFACVLVCVLTCVRVLDCLEILVYCLLHFTFAYSTYGVNAQLGSTSVLQYCTVVHELSDSCTCCTVRIVLGYVVAPVTKSAEIASE